MARINWQDAKRMYVQGRVDSTTGKIDDLSYEDVAREFGVSKGSIFTHAKKDNWDAERNLYKAERDKKISQRMSDVEIPALAEARKHAIANARLIMAQFAKQVKDGDIKVQARDALEASRFIIEQSEMAHGVEHEGKHEVYRRLLEELLKE